MTAPVTAPVSGPSQGSALRGTAIGQGGGATGLPGDFTPPSRFVRAAVITEELRNTTDLAQLARKHDPRLQDAAWLRQVLPQIAQATQRMHARRFCHNDLKWRNILVDEGDAPTAYFIDCPTGMFWWPPFLEYRIVKDLACLDKVAKYTLRRSWRLRFYLDYVGRTRLNAADKVRLRKVLAFFDGRE